LFVDVLIPKSFIDISPGLINQLLLHDDTPIVPVVFLSDRGDLSLLVKNKMVLL
jgi:hypothetical protein